MCVGCIGGRDGGSSVPRLWLLLSSAARTRTPGLWPPLDAPASWAFLLLYLRQTRSTAVQATWVQQGVLARHPASVWPVDPHMPLKRSAPRMQSHPPPLDRVSVQTQKISHAEPHLMQGKGRGGSKCPSSSPPTACSPSYLLLGTAQVLPLKKAC